MILLNPELQGIYPAPIAHVLFELQVKMILPAPGRGEWLATRIKAPAQLVALAARSSPELCEDSICFLVIDGLDWWLGAGWFGG